MINAEGYSVLTVFTLALLDERLVLDVVMARFAVVPRPEMVK